MTRRAFLLLAAGLTTVGAGAVVVARYIGSTRYLSYLVRAEGHGLLPATRLRHRYRWLDVDPAAFDRYVRDYARHVAPMGRFSIPRADFYTRFLLSTTFFTRGAARANAGEPVTYAVFYSPQDSPCYNPFA